jgi:hypothetical protein
LDLLHVIGHPRVSLDILIYSSRSLERVHKATDEGSGGIAEVSFIVHACPLLGDESANQRGVEAPAFGARAGAIVCGELAFIAHEVGCVAKHEVSRLEGKDVQGRSSHDGLDVLPEHRVRSYATQDPFRGGHSDSRCEARIRRSQPRQGRVRDEGEVRAPILQGARLRWGRWRLTRTGAGTRHARTDRGTENQGAP